MLAEIGDARLLLLANQNAGTGYPHSRAKIIPTQRAGRDGARFHGAVCVRRYAGTYGYVGAGGMDGKAKRKGRRTEMYRSMENGDAQGVCSSTAVAAG